jgi:quinol monooxygenase YgiN
MIGICATIRIQDGKAVEFEQLFSDLSAKVKANEAGCLFYQLTKSRREAHTYKVFELYRDQAAVETHMGSEYFKATSKLLRGLMDGAPDIELLDTVD